MRDRQKSLRDGQETSAGQMTMWRDVERLMDMKRRLAAGGGGGDADYSGAGGDVGGGPGAKYGGGVPAAASAGYDENRLVL